MLLPRIIPCLLVKNRGLVKTVQFKNPKYVGDPVNAVKIFNDKEVDELFVLDIDASVHNKKPDLALIKDLASQCRMPLCYGGGVKTVKQIECIIALGVEKVAISSAAVKMPQFISKAAGVFGSQSIIVVMDIKKSKLGGKYELMTHNGTKRTGLTPVSFAKQMASMGAGEIVINAIDRDGGMMGYDRALIRQIHDAVRVPITALGGAGSLKDVENLICDFGMIGAAAGSLYVFKGKYRAVLINYPDKAAKEKMVATAMNYSEFI